MKMVNNYFSLLCCLCSFFSLSCAHDLNPLQLAFIIKTQEDIYPLSEGFDGKTLVKTPYGYTIIKDLKVGDYVVNKENEPKKIVSIGQRLVTQWIEFDIDNESLCVAPDQLFYFPQQQSLIAAKNIFRQNNIFSDLSNVNTVKKINGLKVLYVLTVEDHIFCITHHDIQVHNFNALIINSFCLGHITVVNPVIAILGATISLAKLGYDLYKENISTKSTCQEDTDPSKKISLERNYYAKRRNELLALKNEFIQIKNELHKIRGLISSSFTYEFLQTGSSTSIAQDPYLTLSLEKELRLSLEEKNKLQQDRDSELAGIEQEIFALQLTLALHINELVEQRNMLNESHSNIVSKHNQTFFNGNNQSTACCTISDHNAEEFYKLNLLEEYILNAIINKNNEIQIIINYYMSNKKATFLNQCCSIFDLINQEKDWWKDNQGWITQSKKIRSQNIASVERYLKDRNASTKEFVLSIKKALDKKQKEINKKAFIQANNKLLMAKNAINQQAQPNENEERDTGAQAPGKPTENDGFIPAKNWDGKKVRSPHGGGYGWPDEDGWVWIPTGPKAHGAPHWDVQNPKRPNDHKNILPGGRER